MLTVLMVLGGTSAILRSLDRETARQDRDADRDERDRYNRCRGRALAFQVLFGLNFAMLAGCLIGYGPDGPGGLYPDGPALHGAVHRGLDRPDRQRLLL